MTTFKVQFGDELRRVTLTTSVTLDSLEEKVKSMFPQLQTFVLQVREDDNNPFLCDLCTDQELLDHIQRSKLKKPSICRINVVEGRSRPVIEESVEPPTPVAQKVSEPVKKVPAGSVCNVCSASPENLVKCTGCDYVACYTCEQQNPHTKDHFVVRITPSSADQQLKFLNCSMFEKMSSEQQMKYLNRIANNELDNDGKLEVKKQLRNIKVQKRREERRKQRMEEKKAAKRALKLAEKREKKKKAAVVTVATDPSPQPIVDDTPQEDPVIVPAPVPVEQTTQVQPEEVKEEVTETFVMIPADPVESDWTTDLMSGFRGITNGLVGTISALAPTQETTPEELRIHGIAFGQKLEALEAMGFTDRNKNILLLVKNLASLERTVEDLTS